MFGEKMLKAIFFFLFFLSITHCQDSVSTMISDVIKSLETQSFVVTKLCWPVRKRLQLNKILSGKDIDIRSSELINVGDNHYNQEHDTIFVIDLSCPDVINHIKKNGSKFFRKPFRWIFFGNSALDIDSAVSSSFTNVDIFVDSEVIVIQKTIEDLYRIHFIYKINIQSDWIKEYYGSWTPKNRFEQKKQFNKITSLRRLNLYGCEIKICYVLTSNESIQHLKDEIDDHIDTITKVNFPTTNYLLDFLNAGRKYVFVDTWGYQVNGTWNGMTGYLVREEADIGGSPMFFTQERVSIVDYISSPAPTRSKFVFQQPKLSYENNLFLLPFSTTLWQCTIALVILICPVLFLVTMWEWNKNKNELLSREINPSILRANVIDIVVLMFGAACQQGSHCELKGSLGRIVLLVLFLALMFLYTSYSANIVALLQSSSTHIKTLEDLFNSRLKFGVHDTVFNRYYFSTETETIRKAIYEKKVAPPGTNPRFMSMEEGVKRMQKGLFAFHMETGVGYKFVGKYFNEGEKCGLQEVQYLQVIDPWMAVKKDTPYREMFKIGTKRIQEHGIQQRENLLMYQKRPTCSGGGSNFVSVSMVDCCPAFLILSYGTAVAVLTLAMEFLMQKRQELLHRIHCLS